MQIRPFTAEDAIETARMIAHTLRVSNSADYPADYIEENVRSHSAQVLLERSEQGHMYVVCDGEKIIGCGAIAGFWGSMTESILLTVFVLPEYQGKGVGRRIIETLEADAYFTRAERVEIAASITACAFYIKLGYTYKNGVTTPDEGGCIRLEKQKKASV